MARIDTPGGAHANDRTKRSRLKNRAEHIPTGVDLGENSFSKQRREPFFKPFLHTLFPRYRGPLDYFLLE